MSEKAIAFFVALLLPLAFAACGTGTDVSVERESTPENTSARTHPVGKVVSYAGPSNPSDEEWVLDSLDGEEPERGLNATLVFMRWGEIHGNVGCSDYIILHEFEGDRFRITREDIGSGTPRCDKPQAVKEQEAEFEGVLRSPSSLRIEGQRLELRGTDGKSLTFARPEPPPLDPSLAGTEWILVSLKGEDPVEGTRLTLEIGEDDIGGYSGCNGVGGGFEKMADGKLELSQGDEILMGTSVGCAGERGRQERAYWDALQDASSYSLSARGDRLKLGNDAGEMLLAYEREEGWRSDPAALVGTSWKLRSLNGERPHKNHTPSISFESETRFGGYDGCVPVGGTYKANSQDLLFNSDGMKGYCMKPEAYSKGRLRPLGSSLFEEAVGENKEYRLVDGSGDRLEIRSDGGDLYGLVPLRKGEKVERDGGAWTLQKFVEKGRQVPALEGKEPTLKFDGGFQPFDGGGTLIGFAGCNTYAAAYSTERGEYLDVGSVATTKMSCSRTLMEQERRYLDFLQDARVAYHSLVGQTPSSGTRLRLETGDERAMIFVVPE